ncbi:MAG: phasin family protein [Rhodocyclaceae bacterium]|nr:phasin family protein [Rhodocyclaceae bacterium]
MLVNKIDELTANSKASVEVALKAITSSFGNLERLTALNINTARTLLDDNVGAARAMLSAKDVRELVGLQASLAQPMVEKLAAYNRSVYEIVSQNQSEFVRMVESQIADLNKKFTSALDSSAKSTPVSDVAVAAVKSALAAANSVYDNANKVAKQVAEIAEANMTAATNATVKAVSTASSTTSTKTSSSNTNSKRAAA